MHQDRPVASPGPDLQGREGVPMSESSVRIPEPAPRIANGAWATVLDHHARLLGPRGFIQARADERPHQYAAITRSDELLARGITQAVEGIGEEQIARIVQRAIRQLERGVTNMHQDTWIWLTQVALTYDLFHDHISSADRLRIIEWINPHLEQYTDDEYAFHNSTPSKALCYMRVAYATWGENPKAQAFREYAIEHLYLSLIVPVLRRFGDGGGWTECGWYQRHSLWHCAEMLELARRVEGYDGFQEVPRFWYQRLAYDLFTPYPRPRHDNGTEEFAVEGDGSDRYWSGDEGVHLLRELLAEYFRGSELARYAANRRCSSDSIRGRISEFLYQPPLDQEPLSMDGFPLAHAALGVGKVYARGDWSPDATWFRFECGDYWSGHQHFEVGNFEIFRHETLATESGEYNDFLSDHSVNWLLRTIAHNCILVFDPDEIWADLRDGGRTRYFNDGGQAKRWDPPLAVPTLEQWMMAKDTFTRGRLIAYHDEPGFLYLAGDCTRAYSPRKLASWIRQVVFLRPHTFVLFDRVVSVKPEFHKSWVLHARHAPEVENDRYTITNGPGRLRVQRLLPEQCRVDAIEGYTYGGRSFPPGDDRLGSTACRWRIEEQPTQAHAEHVFLHVLCTDDSAAAHRVQGHDYVGAHIGQTEVRFSGEAGGSLAIGDRVHHLAVEVHRGKYE